MRGNARPGSGLRSVPEVPNEALERERDQTASMGTGQESALWLGFCPNLVMHDGQGCQAWAAATNY